MWLGSIKYIACKEISTINIFICAACCKVKTDTSTFLHVVFTLEINLGSVS